MKAHISLFKRSIGLLTFLILSNANGQDWEVFDMNSAGFPSDEVSAMAQDRSGAIWVATGLGLCRYADDAWEVLQSGTSGLPGNVLTSLAVDTLDRLWVGTLQNGIGVYDGTDWIYYDPVNSGLPDYEIKCITIDHRNWAWIGTYVGLVCFTGSEWRLYNDSDTSYADLALHGNVIEDVQVRTDGLVAIGTQNGGFHYLTDTSVVFLTTYDDNFPDNTQNAIVFDYVNNERWLATPSQGLLRQGGDWWNGPWFKYTTMNSTIPSNAITCLTGGGAQDLWFGTLIAGLGRRSSNGAFVNYTMGNSGLPDNAVNAVLLATDGSVWVGTGYGGAARLTFSSSIPERSVNELRFYPNPTQGPLAINSEHSLDPTPWMMIDPGGRTVMTGTLKGKSMPLDVSGLDAGVYVFVAYGLDGTMTGRVQVLR